MGSIQRTGSATPQITLQQTASNHAVGSAPPVTPLVSTPGSSAPTDALGALSGQGQAQGMHALQSPTHQELKALLDAGKFEELAAQLQKLSPQALQDLPFSVQDIKKVAEGLGFSSKMNMVPFLKPYGTEQKALIEKLIVNADLNNNQKVFALNAYSGPPAVLDYVQRSTPEQLKGLSDANQFMLMAVLDGESSIWDSVTGGAASELSRRFGGENSSDQVAVKILRAAGSESQLLQLLGKVQQFSRDDVTFLYINSLKANELNALSDSTKQALLQHLVDTSISVAGLSLDLNNLKNSDELFGMVSAQHVQAAQRLYTSMSNNAQSSQAVQDTLQKSDQLLAQIQELHTRIEADLKAGNITASKLARYREAVAGLSQQVQDKPEIAAQLQALSQTLDRLESGLNQASQLKNMGLDKLSDLQGQIKQSKTQAQEMGQQVKALDLKLTQQGNQIQTLGQQIEAHYQQVFQLYQQSGEQAESFKTLMSSFESTLASGESLEQKLPQLQALEQQLQRTATQLQQREGVQNRLNDRVGTLSDTLKTQVERFQTLVQDFENNQTQLSQKQQQLGEVVSRYGQQLDSLKGLYQEANTQYNALKSHLDPQQQQPLQHQLTTAQSEIAQHQQDFQALKAQQQKATDATTQLNVQIQPLQQQLTKVSQTLDTQQEQIESQQTMLASTTSQIEELIPFNDELLSQVKSVMAQYKSQLNTMSAQDFQQALQELNTLQGTLSQGHLSPADFAEQTQQLEALKGQIQQMQQHLQRSQSLKNEMGSTLDQLQGQKERITQEISAANEAIELAKTQQAAAEASIAHTQAEIGKLSGQLSEYEAQLKGWEDRLSSLDQSNSTSKDVFMQELEALRSEAQAGGSNPREALQQSRQKLESGFASVETERAQIEAQLANIRRNIALTETDIAQQKQNLSAYQDSLNTQISRIEASTAQASAQREALTQANRNSRALAQELQQLLSNSSPELMNNQHIAEAMQTLTGLQSQLTTDIASSEALIQSSAQHEANTLVQIRQIVAARDGVQQQLEALNTFEQSTLSSAQQASQGIHQRFEALNQREQDVQQRLDNLLVAAREGTISVAAFAAEGKALLEATNTAEGLSTLLDTYEGILMRQASITQRFQESSALQAQNGAFIQSTWGALSAHDGRMAQLQAQFTADSAQVDVSTQKLLSHKRELLEARKSLSISDQKYQKNLVEYEQLLNQGETLPPAAQERLSTLEQQLNSTESRLISSSHELNAEISQLNSLKTRVNQATADLTRELIELETSKQELNALKSTIFKDNDTVNSLKSELRTLIDDTKQLITLLKDPKSFKFKENQEKLAELEKQLAGYESLMAEMDQHLNVNREHVGEVDRLIGAIDIRIANVQHLRTQFSLLFGKVAELLDEAKGALDLVNDLLGTLNQLKSDIQQTREAIAAAEADGTPSQKKNTGTTQSDPGIAPLESSAVQNSNGRSGQGLASQLSQQFTSLIGRRQREQAQAHQQEFQNHLDSLRQRVQAQLESRIQDGEQAHQEALQWEQESRIVNHLLEEALNGNTQVDTTFNVMNASKP